MQNRNEEHWEEKSKSVVFRRTKNHFFIVQLWFYIYYIHLTIFWKYAPRKKVEESFFVEPQNQLVDVVNFWWWVLASQISKIPWKRARKSKQRDLGRKVLFLQVQISDCATSPLRTQMSKSLCSSNGNSKRRNLRKKVEKCLFCKTKKIFFEGVSFWWWILALTNQQRPLKERLKM